MIRLFLLVEGTHEGKELEASKTLKPWGLLRVMTYNKTQDCSESYLNGPGFFLSIRMCDGLVQDYH